MWHMKNGLNSYINSRVSKATEFITGKQTKDRLRNSTKTSIFFTKQLKGNMWKLRMST